MSSAEPPGGEYNSGSDWRSCRRCSTVNLVDPSIGSVYVCAICLAELNEESNRPSSSSTTSSRPLNPDAEPFVMVSHPSRVTISGIATFEHKNPSDNFLHVVSESDFFTDPYPYSESIIATLSRAGYPFSFKFLRSYIHDCVNRGAKINSNLPQHEILKLFQKFDNLNHLEYTPHFVIESLPEVKITEDHVASGKAGCSICTECLNIEEEAKQLPCKHLYHKDCIVRWLKEHKSCPLCRSELKISDPSYDRLRAAWNPQPMVSSAAAEDMVASSDSMATRFQIELLWPGISSDEEGRGGSGEDFSEVSNDNEASGSEEEESGHN